MRRSALVSVQRILLAPLRFVKFLHMPIEQGSLRYLHLDLFARCLDQLAELHAGGTGGFTRAAAQAAVHMLHKFGGNLHASLGHRLHLVNTPAWGIHFYAQHRVGWACRKAEAAVNTLAHQSVGMRLTPQWPLARG